MRWTSADITGRGFLTKVERRFVDDIINLLITKSGRESESELRETSRVSGEEFFQQPLFMAQKEK